MKKNLIYSVVIAVLFTACSDFLDTVPTDQSSPDTFLKNETQARSMLAGIYNCYYDEGAYCQNPYTYENMSDNSYNHHSWEYSQEFGKGTQNASSWLAELKWATDWKAISRANTLLRSMAKADEISLSVKEKITAETRFLRAWFYFDLIRFYGRIPLVDENTSQENQPREDLDKVISFVKADIEYAVNNLPDIKGGEKANKAAALMLKLQLAQYEYDDETVIACAQAIKELGFGLYDDFRTLFLESGMNDPANNEVIFKINYAEDLQSSWYTLVVYNWISFNTTLSMVNSFFTVNGLPVSDIKAEDGTTISADPTYNAELPFENRDPRLKLSVLCPGEWYRIEGGARNQRHFTPANWDCKTGFIAKKGCNEDIVNMNNDGQDKLIMRYGEVLLAWAEAENELNGPSGAYPLIDELRTRVGMVTLSESLPNLTKAGMREIIRNERRVELYQEGQRWHDIRRWKIAEKVMTDAYGLDVSKMQYYPVMWPETPTTDYWKYEPIVVDKRSFNKDRDYLWPIPQKELNANPLIGKDQNPGY